MKVRLDECVGLRLKLLIDGHDVHTVHEMGWSGVKNGQLLALASEHFDVLVTVDRKMIIEQDEALLPLPVLVLFASSIQLRHLKPLVGKISDILEKPLLAKFFEIGL